MEKHLVRLQGVWRDIEEGGVHHKNTHSRCAKRKANQIMALGEDVPMYEVLSLTDTALVGRFGGEEYEHAFL